MQSTILHLLTGPGGMLQSSKFEQHCRVKPALTCCRLRQPALYDMATEEELPVNTLSAVEVETLFMASLQSWKRRVHPDHLPGETVLGPQLDPSRGCLQAEGLRAH